MTIKKSFIYTTLFLLVAVLVVATFWFFKNGTFLSKNNDADYVISSMPYYGIYNHKGETSFVYGDTASAVASIMEYWEPGIINLTETSRYFQQKRNGLITGETIENYVNFIAKDKFEVKRETLEINELKKYVNSRSKTPLFLAVSIDVNQPAEVNYHPAAVVIGVKESEKKVVLNSYWLGNNYEISFEDFQKLWSNMRPDERNKYVIIRPLDDKKIKEVSSRKEKAYPARTESMIKMEGMIKNYVLGLGAGFSGKNNSLALNYFSKVKDDPLFEQYLPPFYKTVVYYKLAEAYLKNDDLGKAFELADKAIERNHDLDKPFNDYPGFDVRENKPEIIDKISEPHRVLGDILYVTKDFKGAEKSYKEALEIKPEDKEAFFGLKRVELVLAKEEGR